VLLVRGQTAQKLGRGSVGLIRRHSKATAPPPGVQYEQSLNRREFNGLCVALASSISSVGTMIVVRSSASGSCCTLMVKLSDGTIVPALGQGSANLAQGRHPEAA